MERTERFYRIIRTLRAARAVTRPKLIESLGVSRAQFTRDMAYLRDRMEAPIAYDADAGGYRLERKDYELPGLWFNASEIHALLAMQELLSEVEPGLLAPHLKPLRERLTHLLEVPEGPTREIPRRIRILTMAHRAPDAKYFAVAARALLERRRLKVRHLSRQTGERTERELSPQRLVHYRDNWYLDAWCHLREGLRSFAVDAFESAEMQDGKAKAVAEHELDAAFAEGYGIFGGAAPKVATLRFSAARARWVSRERWHPKQKSHFDAEGRYVLEVPYSDDRELLMDVLKYGPDVEVVGPPELRTRAAGLLRQAADAYT